MSYVFVSGWKREPGAGGITQYRFDPDSGSMEKIGTYLENETFNVSVMDEEKGILYVLNEIADLPGLRFGGGGRLFLLHLDRETGELIKTDSIPLGCPCPCNLSISADGKYLLVSGHGARGYVTRLERDAFGEYHPVILVDDTPVMLLERKPDGTVGKILDLSKHTGSGPTPKQMMARPHSVTRSPSGKLYAVCDKGNDHIYMYRIDEEHDKLVLCNEPVPVPPGTEPRYCVFHPTLPYFYHNAEHSMELFAYRYDESGRLEPVGKYDALKEQTLCAQYTNSEQQGLCMHPSGQYLYTVLHGPDRIAVFRVSQDDGALTLVQNLEVEYEWPRGITISPDARFLIVTCVRGKKVFVCRIGEDGMLTPTQHVYDQENAAYATFWNV